MAKDAAQVEEATRLYVQERKTLEQVAEETGIHRSTLTRWSAKYDWVKRQARQKQQENDLRALVRKIEMRLANMLAEESDELPDPQLVYALTKALAVLKPPAAVQIRELEKEERDAAALSPEEKRERVKEVIEAIYGISF